MSYKTEKQKLGELVDGIHSDIDLQNEERRARRLKEKEYRAFLKLPRVALTEFWCDRCIVDFCVPSYKVWSYFHATGSWHSVCPDCGLLVYRHISHKASDIYYEKSAKIRTMRSEYQADILRPTEYGFKTLYGDPFEGWYKKFQERSEDIHNKYAGLGIRGTTIDEAIEKQALEDDIKESV